MYSAGRGAVEQTLISSTVTQREAAIISAYTGVLVGDFHKMHQYIEGIMGRPVMTCEMGSRVFWREVKEKAWADLLAIEATA